MAHGLIANVVAAAAVPFFVPPIKAFTVQFPLELINQYYGPQYLSLGESAYLVALIGFSFYGLRAIIGWLTQ